MGCRMYLMWGRDHISFLGKDMALSDERVKLFAERCADLEKKLGVDVVDLYTLFHAQPVRLVSNTN